MKDIWALKAHLGNPVEIGANTCIDRGSWGDTVIGDHSKINNLLFNFKFQIGHNVVIGKCCMLYGQVGIAGFVTMGDYVSLGGRVGVRDHVTIVLKVRVKFLQKYEVLAVMFAHKDSYSCLEFM
ncbi:hypothetical protein R6Q59_016603 [Mikania micrantha]